MNTPLILNDAELATVLAALRYWQHVLPSEGLLHRFTDIASNGGELEPLDPDDIDALCERINSR